MRHRSSRRPFGLTLIALLTAVVLTATLGVGAAVADPQPGSPKSKHHPSMPVVSPNPQQMTSLGGSLAITKRVRLVTDSATDPAALRELKSLLRSHGIRHVDVVPSAAAKHRSGLLTVRLGAADRPDIVAALGATKVPTSAESYGLRSARTRGSETVAIGGRDGAGQFYGVQTLRQLITRTHHGWAVASVSVSDFPSMPLRGTIEGFYGEPWTPAERLDQMDFYGDVKANTYIYAPKDDPYHRDQWREPYPADKLAELAILVQRATDNHVLFTFAVSPGGSICYSDASDRDKLEAKLASMYDLGVRAFSVPLDDISYTRWNCDGDLAAYGPPGRLAAAKAQVSLLNDLQQNWIAGHDGARPLQMVPTEYGDLTDTAYKQEMRATLDPAVEVMWTGTDVVPPSVTNDQADRASELFGRKVFLWDNYPVNDYGNTTGRLLLAPYDKREAGLSDHLTGIVANPMNQPYASKVAVFGTADFTWNDHAYDAAKNWPRAMSYLSGGDRAATRAMLAFGDLEHLAPTFGATPWQPQAPELAARIADFWQVLDGGEPARAIADLRAYAVRIEKAPDRIRDGAVEAGFVTDAAPWLDATELWGQALVTQLDALSARLKGREAKAARLTERSQALQADAAAIRVIPARNSWGEAPVKVGDGVLDAFLADAADLVSHPVAVTAPTKALLAADGTTSVQITVVNRIAGPITDVAVAVGASGGASVEPATVDLGSLGSGESRQATVSLSWAGPPAARLVTLTTDTSWTAGSQQGTATATSDLQATCALTPTRPVAASADSEETTGENAPVSHAIDGDPATFWHTQWSGGAPPPPHQITVDLGAQRSACAVRYLPRQDSANGQIGDYEVYASLDGTTWGDPVATGRLGAGRAEKWIPFAATSARYVRLVALSELNGNPWTTAAEVSVDAR